MLNKAQIIGNLGQDPELRYTASQVPVSTFSVATTDYRASKDGQKQEQTEWHRVVVFGKVAENCSKYLKKGRTVYIEGRMQTRSWIDKNTGDKRYVTEVLGNIVQFLSPNQGSSNRSHNTAPEAGNEPFSVDGLNNYTQPSPAQTSEPMQLNPGAFPKAPEREPDSRQTTGAQGGPKLEEIPFMSLGEWGLI